MNEAKEIKDETTELGLTTATLAGAGVRPVVRTVAASSLSVDGASSTGAATAPARDDQATPLFSPEEAKDFRARWGAIQVDFVDEPRSFAVYCSTNVHQKLCGFPRLTGR